MAAAQPAVTIACLHGAEASSEAEVKSNSVDLINSPNHPVARSSARALCTIRLESVQSSQLFCSSMLELLALCLKAMPQAIMPWSSSAVLTYVTDCIAHAGFSVQASALSALAALLPELEFELISVHALCTVLIVALEARISSETIPSNHPAAEAWQRHMLTCLNLLAGFMDGSHTEAAAAETMLVTLPRVACCIPTALKGFQTQICKLIVHVAKQYPELKHHVVGLMPLSSETGQTQSAVSLAMQLLLQELGAERLDHAFATQQVSSSSLQCCLGVSRTLYCMYAQTSWLYSNLSLLQSTIAGRTQLLLTASSLHCLYTPKAYILSALAARGCCTHLLLVHQL